MRGIRDSDVGSTVLARAGAKTCTKSARSWTPGRAVWRTVARAKQVWEDRMTAKSDIHRSVRRMRSVRCPGS